MSTPPPGATTPIPLDYCFFMGMIELTGEISLMLICLSSTSDLILSFYIWGVNYSNGRSNEEPASQSCYTAEIYVSSARCANAGFYDGPLLAPI